MRKLFSTLKHSVRPRSSTRRAGRSDPARSANTRGNTKSQTPTTSPDPRSKEFGPGCEPYRRDEEQDVGEESGYDHFALTASLEDFPAEIRRHILSMLELDELKVLVRASPVYHQQYLLDRRYLLS